MSRVARVCSRKPVGRKTEQAMTEGWAVRVLHTLLTQLIHLIA